MSSQSFVCPDSWNVPDDKGGPQHLHPGVLVHTDPHMTHTEQDNMLLLLLFLRFTYWNSKMHSILIPLHEPQTFPLWIDSLYFHYKYHILFPWRGFPLREKIHLLELSGLKVEHTEWFLWLVKYDGWRERCSLTYKPLENLWNAVPVCFHSTNLRGVKNKNSTGPNIKRVKFSGNLGFVVKSGGLGGRSADRSYSFSPWDKRIFRNPNLSW